MNYNEVIPLVLPGWAEMQIVDSGFEQNHPYVLLLDFWAER